LLYNVLRYVNIAWVVHKTAKVIPVKKVVKEVL